VARPVGNLPPLAKDLFATPSVATELRLVGLQTMGDIEIRRIGNKRMLDALMRLMPVPANSDFKPFVDLNAPRMRFLNHSAVDLIALMILPTPLADIFGAPQLQAASDSRLRRNSWRVNGWRSRLTRSCARSQHTMFRWHP
jgi:hypothetical protein